MTISFTCYSQTTEEEYKYCMYGYETMINNGLDMKQGYYFEDFSSNKISYLNIVKYTFEIKVLVRKKTQEPAAILIIAKNHNKNKSYYDCIPLGSYTFSTVEQNFYGWESEMIEEYAKAMKGFVGSGIDLLYYCKNILKKK
jgi:hypothetical protein